MKFVEIVADARSVHGAFYKGEVRCVTDEVAGDLKGKGWAVDTEALMHEVGNKEKPAPATLEIQNGTIGTKSPEVGL